MLVAYSPTGGTLSRQQQEGAVGGISSASAADTASPERKAVGLTPLNITIREAQNLPIKDVSSKTNPFVVVEAAGVRAQTKVEQSTINPSWDEPLTLRCVFGPGVREELVVSVWHEDVFEDVLLGRGTLAIPEVLHEREIVECWLELLDERGLRAIGADVRLEVQNGKAPPLMDLCASDDVTCEEIERSITQEPAQCDEREVDEESGRTCLHLLLGNEAMDDEMLNLLLKCNPKQARVPDRHGTTPLGMLCRRFGLTEGQLTMMLKCHPAAARTANRFGKLPLHFLARNPSLTKGLLAILLGAFSGAAEAKDLAGNLPLHYLARNRALSKDLLQGFLEACGAERARAYADTPNKLGQVPLRELVFSDAFTDQHLRVMLRVSEQSTQARDRYGQAPLHYLGWNTPATPFQAQVAEEATLALDESMKQSAGLQAEGRFVDDSLSLKLLLNVQKYSLWFHDFAHVDMRKLQHGNALGQHRLLVTRFNKGDYIMRMGEPATFLAILLQGELGVRTTRGQGFGPRRLHKGALFGERGLFSSKPRAADIIALSSGYIGTMLYSELELLSDAHSELMRTFNLALAKGALEERLADTGLSLDDLEPHSLHEQVNDLLSLQSSAGWRGRHAELQAAREGLYAELYAEKEAQQAIGGAAGGASNLRLGASRALKGIFAKGKSAGANLARRASTRRSSNAGASRRGSRQV